MSRFRKPLAALVATVTVAFGGLTVYGTAAATPAQPAPEVSHWPHQEALSEAAITVEGEARRRFPTIFGGVEVDVPRPPRGWVMVHRIPGPSAAEFEREMRKAARPFPVEFVDAVYTEQHIDFWATRIFRDQAWWGARGVELIGTAPELGQCVTVWLGDLRDGPAVIAHYPQVAICLREGEWPEPLTGSWS
ncbi:hypothetical protein E1091_01580 [Micromonospora fluostatini]|uniref:Secreted protein n=1 Tax=Micromonospora fluostatini TaxID=1629071 RepID=A0ABY2DRF3_9ACTN|nr:hypothetical protein E1091_01580 [Micromonospora fluostatini]